MVASQGPSNQGRYPPGGSHGKGGSGGGGSGGRGGDRGRGGDGGRVGLLAAQTVSHKKPTHEKKDNKEIAPGSKLKSAVWFAM